MANWSMTCTCGEVMEAEGDTAEEAVDKIMVMMTPEATAAHMAEKHDGAPGGTPEQQRAMLMGNAVAV